MELYQRFTIEIIVGSAEYADMAIKAIKESAHTGKIGDGKILYMMLRVL